MDRALIQEAYELFKPIPENEWCISVYSTHGGTQYCAIGHYIRLKLNKTAREISFSKVDEEVTGDLRRETKAFIAKKSGFYNGGDIANVNNRYSMIYPQSTPKARVLALLEDMLAA